MAFSGTILELLEMEEEMKALKKERDELLMLLEHAWHIPPLIMANGLCSMCDRIKELLNRRNVEGV